MSSARESHGERPNPNIEQTLVLLAKAFVLGAEEIARLGGVTPQQWAAMHQIHLAGKNGLPPSALADIAETSRANITKIVSRLARIGFVSARPDPADGRGKRFVLTRTGKKTLETMNREKQARIRTALQEFSAGERASLQLLAQRLVKRLAAPGRRPTGRSETA